MITGQDTKTGLLGRNTRTGYSRTGSQDNLGRIPGQGNRTGYQDRFTGEDTRTDNQDKETRTRKPGQVIRT